MKKILLILVALLLFAGLFTVVSRFRSQAPATETSLPVPANMDGALPSVPDMVVEPEPGAAKEPEAGTQTVVVTYTDAGYSPADISIKNGDRIIFQNNSSRAMWTASAFHPSHRAYPTTGGCIGSSFDACAGIQPGESWAFTFNVSGTWKYHNHLLPAHTGSVVVE